MLLKFELSMPNVGSWNGHWSGERDLHARVIQYRGKEKEEKAKEILKIGYFHYNFGDGWSAGISVEKIDSKEAVKVRRKSSGFCGYDWMIHSINKNNKIIPPSEDE